MKRHRWIGERTIVAGVGSSPMYEVCARCGLQRHDKRPQFAVSGRLSSLADILARQESSPLPDEMVVRRCLDLLRDITEEIARAVGCEHVDVDLERCPKCGQRHGEPHEAICTEQRDTQLSVAAAVDGAVRVADGKGGWRWERPQ